MEIDDLIYLTLEQPLFPDISLNKNTLDIAPHQS